MKFIVDSWYLILVAIISGGLLLWPLIKGGAVGAGVGTAEAVRLINRERAVLIDVSEPAEYAAGHPAGARSVPLAKLPTATTELPKNKAVPLVVVCSTGNRASKGVAILKKLGFENSQALSGGLAAWRTANLPVDKSA